MNDFTAIPPEWGRHYAPRELALMFYNAGWTDAQKLLEAVSVCIAESNGYEHRTNVNPDGSIDRGIWMINDLAHPDITDAMAFNAVRATVVARKLYVGKNYKFTSWAAYNNEQYKGPRAMGYAFDGVANFLRIKNGYSV